MSWGNKEWDRAQKEADETGENMWNIVLRNFGEMMQGMTDPQGIHNLMARYGLDWKQR